tara:strand:+ start:47 stop:673 length:627 start_codon:yes stop_codon:yes gene_type:complete
MRILIACEYSGRVRDAFAKQGHTAVSCDLRPTESPNGWHITGDVLDVLGGGWDMLIGHPYCTYNCLSGIRWMYHPNDTELPAEQRRRHPAYPNRMQDFEAGAAFFNALKNSGIKKICLENSQPHGLAMSRIGRYTQAVQPWMFGDAVTKGAYLWLDGLPPLVPTHRKSDFEKIYADCHMTSPGPDRERERSRTRQSIADAMAEQWGQA